MSFSRVLFVFPETRYPTGQPPLGLAYLTAAIRDSSDADVELYDMSFASRPFEGLASRLGDYRPDLVGISVVTSQLTAALEASRLVRECSPGSALILGGPHATVLPEETLLQSGADMVYAGEAERAVSAVVRGEPWTGLPGACYHAEGSEEPVRNPGLLLTEDLDSLPIPDRSIFDMQTYVRHWYSMDRVDPSLRGTSIMGTRGCPFRCTFCQPTISEIFGQKMRKRSPEGIVEELLQLRSSYSLDAFMFEDSTFILDSQWVHDICDELISADIGMKWCCNVRADLLEEDLLDHMIAAGLRKINIGVESASQRVLDDIYDKGITVEGVRRALRMAKKRGISVQGYFMLGAPGETLEEMRSTVSFAVREPFDDALFDITTPFPHTRLWDSSRHLIRMDYSHFDCFRTCVYDLGDITPGQVERLKKRAYWRFYLDPGRILSTFRTALGLRRIRRTLAKMRRV
ncbi:cobalamin-dependent protein [Candidatus Fermentibacterales bacterium]|nr:cobalamin-dependent protein [Candidatus Fermentibacterales bacterium]